MAGPQAAVPPEQPQPGPNTPDQPDNEVTDDTHTSAPAPAIRAFGSAD